jgi:hypothetical protein
LYREMGEGALQKEKFWNIWKILQTHEPLYSCGFQSHLVDSKRGLLKEWWAVRDSNPGLPACKAGALTN